MLANMKILAWSVILLVVLSAKGSEGDKKKVVCYYSSWVYYRSGDASFDIKDIDPSLCTHIIYAFLKLQGTNITYFDEWLDRSAPDGLGNIQKFTALKKVHNDVKFMATLGGANARSYEFSVVARSAETRSEFSKNLVQFLKSHDFDGFDFDWEYPTKNGGSPKDKENFVLLLQVLKKELEAHNLLLSVAVATTGSAAEDSYDIENIHKHVDFINFMSYDLNGPWSETTGINAPLYSGDGLNVKDCLDYWLAHGAPSEKIVMGIPFYGKSFRLADPEDHDVGALAMGPGEPGPITKQEGLLGYNEICLMNWTRVFEESQQVPYAYKDDQWVGFDDVQSVTKKVSVVKELNLGGAMIWSLEQDDFRGNCGQGKYPLLTAINKGLYS